MAETSQTKALRRLYLTLFLRGRGFNNSKVKEPTSIFEKLRLTLLISAAIGLLSVSFIKSPIYNLSFYLHAMNMLYAGSIIAASSSEALFNEQELEILLHRPVKPQQLLRAKLSVLMQVTLMVCLAVSAPTLIVSCFISGKGPAFALAHLMSTSLLVPFTASLVVLIYQLCLKALGKEKLQTVLTASQGLLGVGFILILHFSDKTLHHLEPKSWLGLAPMMWFAGVNDAIHGLFHGRFELLSWGYALAALAITGLLSYLALERLAQGYGSTLQALNESAEKKKSQRHSFLRRLADLPPLSLWLKEPLTKASFILCASYILKDRDLRMRMISALSPMVTLPILWMSKDAKGGAATFFVIVTSFFVALTPSVALSTLSQSPHFKACELFYMAPIQGPSKILDGARRAVLLVICIPMVLLVAIAAVFKGQLELALPGLLLVPLLARFSSPRALPLSRPVEDGASQTMKSMGRILLGVLMGGVLTGLTFAARHFHALPALIFGEALLVLGIYLWLRRQQSQITWEEYPLA